ncbi:MAG: hypothetical protein IT258_06265 [Saprospiraceae bacterium]|nr:hypothetical protein [Saprospiraceae bacterium]
MKRHLTILLAGILACLHLTSFGQSCTGNLFINSGFESNLTSWNNLGTASIVTDAHNGTKSLKVCGNNGDSRVIQAFPVSPGQSLNLSFWAKKTGASGFVRVKTLTANYQPTTLFAINVSSATWQAHNASILIPAGAAFLEIGAEISNAAPTECAFFDDFCLTGGSIPNCNIAGTAVASACNNNGTPNNPADDIFNMTVTVSGVTGGWTGTLFNGQVNIVGNGTQPASFEFLVSAIQPYLINGVLGIELRSDADPNCYTNIFMTPPTPCTIAPADQGCFFEKLYTTTTGLAQGRAVFPKENANGTFSVKLVDWLPGNTYSLRNMVVDAAGEIQTPLAGGAIPTNSFSVFDNGYLTFNGSTGNQFTIRRYDLAGVQQWEKTYTLTGVNTLQGGLGMAKVSDGFIFSGIVNKPGLPTNEFYPFFLKTNDLGVQVWQKVWNTTTPQPGTVRLLDEAVGGGYYFDIPLTIGISSMFTKVDANGNKVWEYGLGSSPSFSLNGASDSPDGLSVYVAMSGSTQAPQSSSVLFVQFYRFDANGNLIWNNLLSSGTVGLNYANASVLATDDGAVIAFGSNLNGSDRQFHYRKLDLSGNQVWAKTKANRDARIVQKTSDGGLLFAGTDFGSPQIPYLLKTTANGNETPVCQASALLPDLTLTDLQVPATVVAGSSFTANIIVRNIGTAASVPTGLLFYLGSQNPATIGVPAIPAGGQLSYSPTIQTSPNYTGPASLQAKIDQLGNVNIESNENNNEIGAAFNITSGGGGGTGQIDLSLALQQLTASPAQWSNYSVKLTISNAGPQTATGVKVKFAKPTGVVYVGGNQFTASQGTFNPNGDEVWTVGSIPANGSATLTVNYFLLNATAPVAYAQVTAANETDSDSQPNNGTPPTPVQDDEASTAGGTTPTLPDITLSTVVFPPGGSVAAGAAYSINFLPSNLGGAIPASQLPVTGRFYLSLDNVLSASDVLVGTSSNVPITTTQQSISGTVPASTPAGQYYAIVQLDPNNTVAESNENNNVAASGLTVTVTGGSAFSCPGNLIVNGGFESQPVGWLGAELVSSDPAGAHSGTGYGRKCATAANASLNVMSQLLQVQGGNTYLLTAFVKKGSSSATGFMRVNYFNASNTQLGSSTDAVASGTAWQQLSLTLAPPVGTTQADVQFVAGPPSSGLCFMVDDVCLVLTSTGTQPDLTLADLQIPTASVVAGAILSYNFDASNAGTAAVPGNFTIKSYISTDQTLSSNDVQDGNINTGNYAAGFSVQNVPGASTIPASLAAGQYYLIVKIDGDNAIAESNENNNTVVKPFTVTASGGGGTPDCNAITITPGVGKITIAGFSAPHVLIKVFKPNWTVAYECLDGQCATPTVVTGLGTGSHFVEVKLMNATWGEICKKTQTVGVTNIAQQDDDRMRLSFDKFYPNPTAYQTTMELYSPVAQQATLDFYDRTGRLVHTQKVELDKGQNLIEQLVFDWKSGTYNVVARGEKTGLPAYGRFLKVWEE